MKWTVLATDQADQELTEIWLSDADRNSITQASLRIDRELANDPDKKGEDYYGDRIIEYGPLAVAYELQPEDRIVKIIQVMRIRH